MGTFGTNRIYTFARVVKVRDRMRPEFAPAWVRFPPYLKCKNHHFLLLARRTSVEGCCLRIKREARKIAECTSYTPCDLLSLIWVLPVFPLPSTPNLKHPWCFNLQTTIGTQPLHLEIYPCIPLPCTHKHHWCLKLCTPHIYSPETHVMNAHIHSPETHEINTRIHPLDTHVMNTNIRSLETHGMNTNIRILETHVMNTNIHRLGTYVMNTHSFSRDTWYEYLLSFSGDTWHECTHSFSRHMQWIPTFVL